MPGMSCDVFILKIEMSKERGSSSSRELCTTAVSALIEKEIHCCRCRSRSFHAKLPVPKTMRLTADPLHAPPPVTLSNAVYN